MSLTDEAAASDGRAGLEFIALVALTTSLVAMSIDTMLPALGYIASDLELQNPNDRQWVLTAFFFGLTLGQLVVGPMSDHTGRKPALYAGLGLFVVGASWCALAPSFGVLVAGRALQGFGAAGPRVVAVAIVRDLHSGRGMARVMSFVQSVFILVPVLAPAFGQSVLLVAPWRVLFWILAAAALLDGAWFGLRQRETLPVERRAPISVRGMLRASGEVLRHRVSRNYTLATGAVFGALIGYLSMSQQVFQELYGLGELFPVFFGACALSLGLASLTNARLVMRLGMRSVSRRAVITEVIFSSAFLLAAVLWDGHPPLWFFTLGMMVCFFCNGLLFGNYNARAMQPMAHIAGAAAAVTGALGSLVALALGTPLGWAYDGTVIPLIGGFAALSAAAFGLTELAERPPRNQILAGEL